MSLQYITDGKGQTTGVFIPIDEWNDLKSKFKEVDFEDIEIPEWQKKIAQERAEQYKNNPEQVLDFDTSIDEIERSL